MSVSDYADLVRYHHWGNRKILTTANKLSQDQMMGEKLASGSTPFEVLRHMLDVDWSWRLACIEEPATQVLWERVPMENMKALKAYWVNERKILLDYVESLSGEDLEREVVPSWSKRRIKIKHIITHIVAHGTEHRTELGWHFTGLGYSPGDLSFLKSLKSS